MAKKAKKPRGTAPEEQKKRRRRRKEWTFTNFQNVLALPERLATYLRLLLHLDKTSWDFCLDKLRQHVKWEAEVEDKRPKVQINVKGRERTSRSGPAYLAWSKSKGRGKGRRYFAAPCDELGRVQKSILHRFISQVFVHFARYGGQVGSSIMANAGHHAGFAKSVFSLDIVNAYPTVYRSRVRATLRKPFEFALRQFKGVTFSEEDVLKMLDSITDLIVFKDRLPQGPPTSPRVFDIVCGKMDQEIFQWLESNATPFQGYRYSAWTDNLTISSDGEIPLEVRQKVIEIVRENGFFPHMREDKMKYFSPETGERPIVTGLVVLPDGRITMAPRKVNQLRARLHQLMLRKAWDKEAMMLIDGTIGFVREIYPKNLPSKLRDVVLAVEARRASMRVPVVHDESIEDEDAIMLDEDPETKVPSPSKKKDEGPTETVSEVVLM